MSLLEEGPSSSRATYLKSFISGVSFAALIMCLIINMVIFGSLKILSSKFDDTIEAIEATQTLKAPKTLESCANSGSFDWRTYEPTTPSKNQQESPQSNQSTQII